MTINSDLQLSSGHRRKRISFRLDVHLCEQMQRFNMDEKIHANTRTKCTELSLKLLANTNCQKIRLPMLSRLSTHA